MIVCCTIVQRFVVIQDTSRPAGNRITNVTKTNGSAMKIIRCVRSVVVDISSVENNCEPTYMMISTIRTPPVALFVRSGMNRNDASPPSPHGIG